MISHFHQNNLFIILLIAATVVNIFVDNEQVTTIFNVVVLIAVLVIAALTRIGKSKAKS